MPRDGLLASGRPSFERVVNGTQPLRKETTQAVGLRRLPPLGRFLLITLSRITNTLVRAIVVNSGQKLAENQRFEIAARPHLAVLVANLSL